MSLDTENVANIGRYSSNLTGWLTVAFALSTIFDFGSNWSIDFFVCFLLPIAYLFMTLANRHIVKTFNNPVAAFYSDAAVQFAVTYGCFICMVYYVQLTFVRNTDPDPIAQSIVKYWPGTACFAVDILGYTFLGFSTICLALSLEAGHKVLVRLLYLHGFMSFTGFLIPFLPFVYKQDDDDDGLIWQLPLFSWCSLFAPICFLMAQYFKSLQSNVKRA